MTFLCIWSPEWGAGFMDSYGMAVLKVAPRVTIDAARRQIWADGKSLQLREICQDIRTQLQQYNVSKASIGISSIPIAAEIASRGTDITVIPGGEEKEFLARHPISVLSPSPPLANLFDGVGIETCGDLAILEQEPVEVRFGAEGVHLWRLARADDNRLIFAVMPRSLPQASMDWVDYTLSDP